MSVYEGDLRVVLNADGTAVVPDGPDGQVGDWRVFERHGKWVAHNDDQGFLHSVVNASQPARFDSRDEVLAAMIGDPQ